MKFIYALVLVFTTTTLALPQPGRGYYSDHYKNKNKKMNNYKLNDSRQEEIPMNTKSSNMQKYSAETDEIATDFEGMQAKENARREKCQQLLDEINEKKRVKFGFRKLRLLIRRLKW